MVINSTGLTSNTFDTNGHTVVVQAGDSITFLFGSFPPSIGHLTDVSKLLVSGLPGGSFTISKTSSKRITFASPGSPGFSWAGYTSLGVPVSKTVVPGATGSGTIQVLSITSPTPSDGGSSSSSGGTGGSTDTPTGGSTSGGGTGGVPTSAHGSATNPNVHIPGPSDHGNPSTSRARSTTPGGTITFPTESPSSATPTTSVTTQVVVQADATRSSHKDRPIGLAIISILALAAVTGAYIYQYLGGFGALRGATAGGGSRSSRHDDPPRRNGPTPGPRANNGD